MLVGEGWWKGMWSLGKKGGFGILVVVFGLFICCCASVGGEEARLGKRDFFFFFVFWGGLGVNRDPQT